MKKNPEVNNYISGFPKETQDKLEELRAVISKAAPDAEEVINYAMPTFTLQGNLVHFAGYKNHIGFYPAPSGIKIFKEELSIYKNAKGSVQFPLDQPIPVDLVSRIVKFRVDENIEIAQSKVKKKIPAKSSKLSDEDQVSAHIQKLDPKIAETVEYIRKVILSADKEIAEQIKWNSPSFYYTGEMKPFDPKEYKRDIVVLNLNKGKILLVFPSGAKVNDKSGFLEGDYKDGRRLVHFKDIDDVKSKEKNLQQVIKEWIAGVEK
ncbi:DUF1801 domain-containing protein [Dyadobacter psychrotolerans]|uniref:DUF1801 domain-containing protein n=1 Tax=Dyadobacter psychrotolerans TaxID=2541721 RepID=UPI00140452CF|nr:DUF1801 domain-containing protein [Dyadobacter psychrotolerans]